MTTTRKRPWTRHELLIAFGLYCQIPFGKLHKENAEVKRFAALLRRTPSALAMKLTNIASLDPAITATGRKGLPGASAADRSMWQEMQSDWSRFAAESEAAITAVMRDAEPDASAVDHEQEEPDYRGRDAAVQTTARVGQGFFRKAVLSAYNYRCCITGLAVRELLIASHIVPWRHDESNRLNPRNGLALSALHDRAFDLGLITLDENMSVQVCCKEANAGDAFYVDALLRYEGRQITLPEKFPPEERFLAYHRSHVFLHSM
ncbi:restriction endonuclease [Thioalkalivibrio denitrificans]|uniref:Restriction endonuclease n=1 Tax=Thioalkalivibrio denitrificans TaxID=108003 RepID=A0A1V3NS70_9GAMM|nr:HNH endonuclease [Thioalkalivibrio denitrificans]OOG27864.1 restriction endonuclease [Thioalkalivibrio denitrificans]